MEARSQTASRKELALLSHTFKVGNGSRERQPGMI
jgi:hypothetical protein